MKGQLVSHARRQEGRTVTIPLSRAHDDLIGPEIHVLDPQAAALQQPQASPYMPHVYGGMGLGHVELAMVQAEARGDELLRHDRARGLGRIIDRSIQVHGALGYSTDTPLAHMYQHARWARFADGPDEVHQMRIAQRTIAAYTKEGSTRSATGDLPL